MNIRTTLLATATGIALLTGPLNAGGPVLTEDAYEAEPQHDRKIGGLLIVGAALMIAIALTSGKGNCHGDTPEPSPEPGPC